MRTLGGQGPGQGHPSSSDANTGLGVQYAMGNVYWMNSKMVPAGLEAQARRAEAKGNLLAVDLSLNSLAAPRVSSNETWWMPGWPAVLPKWEATLAIPKDREPFFPDTLPWALGLWLVLQGQLLVLHQSLVVPLLEPW